MLGGELNESSFGEWLNAAQGGDETRRHVQMIFGGGDKAAAAQPSDESTIVGSPQNKTDGGDTAVTDVCLYQHRVR